MTRLFKIGSLLLAISVLLALTPVIAAQDDVCPTLVEEALSDAGGCAGLGPNEVCFGHGGVESVVNCEVAPAFDSPGDSMGLDVLCSLTLSGLQAPDQWGVALMQVQPPELDQPISYVLFGDVEMQNASSASFELQVAITADTSNTTK